MENLLDKKQLAEKLNISVKTIDLWVRTKKGPRHFRIGKLVRFKVKDAEEFIEKLKSEGINGQEVSSFRLGFCFTLLFL